MGKLFLTISLLAAILSWTAPSGPVDGYNIYRAVSITSPFVKINTDPITILTFADPLSAPGNCYRVTAFNTLGESQPSNNACIFIITPAPPTLTIK